MSNERSESSFKLQDRTAIITGPCNTTNQAIAMKFTQMGVNVALIDRNIEKSERFANQLMDEREAHERYGRAIAIQADMSKSHHIQEAIGRVAESFGGIDIFIDGLMITDVRPFKDPKALEDIDRAIDVNLRSPLLTTHAALRYLESRKRGRVIYLLNDISRIGMTKNGLHTATRTGLIAFARTLAREVAENNVTVNCVALGLTEEFLLSQNGTEQVSIQEAQNRVVRNFPFAQMTEPEKTANLVAFLASPLGSGITGQTIAVSQGMSFLG